MVISIIFATALVGGALFFAGSHGGKGGEENENNVSMVGGVQIVEIGAKGGYSPQVTTARAGVSTVLRVETRGTFDCSSALTIPAIGYSKNLPPSGTTDIDIPPQEPGAVVRGLCSMGMYNFSVEFI